MSYVFDNFNSPHKLRKWQIIKMKYFYRSIERQYTIQVRDVKDQSFRVEVTITNMQIEQ